MDKEYCLGVTKKLFLSFRMLYYVFAYGVALFIFFTNLGELWNNTEKHWGNAVGAILALTIPFFAHLLEIWVRWVFEKDNSIHA